jgi:heptosyltransferase I
VNRILLVRTSAIGDVVFALPLAHALRRSFPRAHIAWLVEPGIAGLLEAEPALDEVIVWPKRDWATLWQGRHAVGLARAVLEFRGLLRARRFDTALDLQGLLKSAALAKLSGAPQRIGLGSREGSRLLMTRTIERGGAIQRISSEYLHFAQALGLDVGDFVPRLQVSGAADVQARVLLDRHALVPGRFVAFAPFTTRPQKHWFEDAWSELASLVRDELGLTPVLLGGPANRAPGARLSGHGRMTDLTGHTPLAQSAAVIRHAALVVGVDTGLTHIGIALDRPTVALFGSTRPYLDACRRNARVIWLGLPCSPCRRAPTCNGAFTCLRDITPARVLHEAQIALADAA